MNLRRLALLCCAAFSFAACLHAQDDPDQEGCKDSYNRQSFSSQPH